MRYDNLRLWLYRVAPLAPLALALLLTACQSGGSSGGKSGY